MTIPLQWLVANPWVFYVVCAIGMVVYLVRALAAQREFRLAMFTLERDAAIGRLTQSWIMVFVFAALGVLIYAGVVYVLPDLPISNPPTDPAATATLAAGLTPPTLTPTATITPAASPDSGELVGSEPEELSEGAGGTSEVVGAPVTVTPEPEPTETVPPPEIGISREVRVRFGGFAELVGYSLPSAEVTAGQTVQVTLYWQVINAPGYGYLVFTHMLSPDGSLIAQHDGPPADGSRPTDTWIAGESIIDSHSLVSVEPGYGGEAVIVVGLYDPAVGRVLTDSGADSVVLPTTITVLSQ
ncbi:MAG: hypothetical protein GX620_06490 [Chloroflexi bacterium]|nr:hypothetical protein [Chloroflexota bacterium]